MSNSATFIVASPLFTTRLDRHKHHLANRYGFLNYSKLNKFSLSSTTITRAGSPAGDNNNGNDNLWDTLCHEALLDTEEEPMLRPFYEASVLCYPSMEYSLVAHLAAKLGGEVGQVSAGVLCDVLHETLVKNTSIGVAIRADLKEALDRDLGCSRMIHRFLYSKRFLALQIHRIAHQLWKDGRKILALFLQKRVWEEFAIEIEPVSEEEVVVGRRYRMPNGVTVDELIDTSWSDYVI